MTSWKFKKFNELTIDELYAVLALRQEVFVIEQRSIYKDLDYLDQDAFHLMCYLDNRLATYLRVLPPNPNDFCIGRVVTAAFARQQGLAKVAMQKAMEFCREMEANRPIRLSAQVYLVGFYESFGFTCVGDRYDDGGVEHIDMVSGK